MLFIVAIAIVLTVLACFAGVYVMRRIMEHGQAVAAVTVVTLPKTPTAAPAPSIASAPIEAKPKRKRKRPTPKPAANPSPVESVAGLLKDPDSLATAFLLREILAPPKSRRG